MLQNLYRKYILDNLSKYSPLDIKLGLFSKYPLEYPRMFCKYNKYKSAEIFADYMHETGRNVEEYILKNESIEHVQNAKTNINLKRTTNPKKIIQYTLVYYCVTENNLDSWDLKQCRQQYLTIEERLNLLYSIIKFYSDSNKELSVYAIDELSTFDITNDREGKKFISEEEANIILNETIESVCKNVDDLMKNKLENLLNAAGITDYEIQPYNITEHIPSHSSRWYGGDSGGLSRTCDGTIKETTHDFGYIALVKKPSAQISTDGKDFYITFNDISQPIVYSELDIINYADTGRNVISPYKVNQDALIEILKLNKDLKPTVIGANISIKKFKDYSRSHPYNLPFYELKGLTQRHEGSKCHPLCVNIQTTTSYNGSITIDFTFMSKVFINKVKDSCDAFIQSFIEDNVDTIKLYSENYYIDDLCNKPKYYIESNI